MAELLRKIYHQIFYRSLGTSPLELVIFFTLLVLFVLWLVIANRRRISNERQRLSEVYEKKWQIYCRKYEITHDEAHLLEELSKYLDTPEQKYVLLVNNHLFDSCLRHHLRKGGGGEELARNILLKAGLKPVSEELKGITFMRRSKKRKKVDIQATLTGLIPGSSGVSARMYDLSSRGAAVENPEGGFNAGDDVRLSFSYGELTYTNITAEVLRVSDEGQRLHLLFHRMGTPNKSSA